MSRVGGGAAEPSRGPRASEIRVPNKDHKRHESRARDEWSAPRTHLQGRLEHSLKLSESPRVFQASRVYVALVRSVVIIAAYSYGDTERRRKMPALASGAKTLASIFWQPVSGASHAAQRCFSAGLRLVLDYKTLNPNHLC